MIAQVIDLQAEFLNIIKNAGIVGAGGAGFPTHVKAAAKAEYVIVNGAECEPLLRVDQQLLEVEAENVIAGLEAVVANTGAVEGIIALKAKYKKAIAPLEQAISGKPLRLFLLEDFYPAGDEQVLVKEVLDRVVPEGGIPLKVGCVINNVETFINIAQALKGRPVTETYLTVNGDVPKPLTLKLPVGTPVQEALALAGCVDCSGKVVIDGGPMMGKVIKDLSRPVTKTTKGLIVLPEGHPAVINKTLAMERILRKAKTACIQCSYCTDLCPRNHLGHRLQPHLIMRGIQYTQGHSDVMRMAYNCVECGVCEKYACIMELSPRRVNMMLKQELRKSSIKPLAPPEKSIAISQREYRKVPVKRLIARLGLLPFDKPAPLGVIHYEPRLVRIPLSQNVGAPSIPVVVKGQRVQKGLLIAQVPSESLGANIHASIDGIVAEISDFITIEAGHEGGIM